MPLYGLQQSHVTASAVRPGQQLLCHGTSTPHLPFSSHVNLQERKVLVLNVYTVWRGHNFPITSTLYKLLSCNMM